MATDLVTIKVSPSARMMLRVLAAHSGQEMHEQAEAAFWAEIKRKRIGLSNTLKGIEKRFKERPLSKRPKESKVK